MRLPVKMNIMDKCLNCHEKLNGSFCHACGQDTAVSRYSLKILIRESLDDLIHFDSDFIRTFTSLLIRPGFFVREYLLGKRMHFVSPLRYFFGILGVNIAFSFILDRPAINPAEISRGDILFLDQINSFLITLVFLIVMIPFAAGLRLSDRKADFSMVEYFSFFLYLLSQSVLLYILLQGIMLIYKEAIQGPTEAVIWGIIFSILYFRAYLQFNAGPVGQSVIRILISYGFTLITFTVLLTVVRLILI